MGFRDIKRITTQTRDVVYPLAAINREKAGIRIWLRSGVFSDEEARELAQAILDEVASASPQTAASPKRPTG